jgi:hypothetical protein
MNSVSDDRQGQPAKWERVYLQLINLLFTVAGMLFTWNVFSTSDWRVRSGYLFIVGWILAVRGGGRWIPARVNTSVRNWLAASRLRAFSFNLLWIGFPLIVFGYLVRWHSRWELLTMIVLMSVIPLFIWRSDPDTPRTSPSN